MSQEQEQSPEFKKFLSQFNEEYTMQLRNMGLQNEYVLEVDGKPVTYVRKRLTTKRFNFLESEKARVEKENSESIDIMANAKRQADLYLTIAKEYLTNKETGQPITEDEMGNMIWEDIKIVCDSCQFRSIIGVPNAVKASGISSNTAKPNS